jgi:hypothetical protein
MGGDLLNLPDFPWIEEVQKKGEFNEFGIEYNVTSYLVWGDFIIIK